VEVDVEVFDFYRLKQKHSTSDGATLCREEDGSCISDWEFKQMLNVYEL